MKSLRLLLPALVAPCVLLLLNSCSTNGPLSQDYHYGTFNKASRSSTEAVSAGAIDKALAERPGLGTTLGHEVWDSTTDAHFYRRHQNSPDKLASFYYNDEEGAKAMAGFSGPASKHRGRFDLAEGTLRASISAGWGDDRCSWYEAGGKIFVVGKAGQSYSIELENTSKQRVEVVVSVDGLDVLDGAPAAFSKRGYVIPPRSTINIRGMRVGGKLRSFEFGSVRDSQAAKSGGEKAARNVGVIGVALFIEDEEAAKHARIEEGMKRGDARAFPGS